MLWALGLFAASFSTAFSAGFLDRTRPEWSLWHRLLLASFATPFGWTAFQAAILPIVLADVEARSRFGALWPSYLDDVVVEPALKLWLCGALCAVFLWHVRSGSSESIGNSRRGYLGLYCLCLSCAAAILLPIGTEQWIDTGQIGGRFALTILACAFLVGFMPVAAVTFGLLYAAGAAGLRRAGEPFAAIYGLAIAWGAYAWHGLVANRPGASAIIPMAVSALFGVLTGWIIVRRANRAARQAEPSRIN